MLSTAESIANSHLGRYPAQSTGSHNANVPLGTPSPAMDATAPAGHTSTRPNAPDAQHALSQTQSEQHSRQALSDDGCSCTQPHDLTQGPVTRNTAALISQSATSPGLHLPRTTSSYIHIVGRQGVGKTTLALDIIAGLQARRKTARLLADYETPADIKQPFDVVIVEHVVLPNGLTLLKNDLLITMQGGAA